MKTIIKFTLITFLSVLSILFLNNCGQKAVENPSLKHNIVSVDIKYNNHPNFAFRSTTFDIWTKTSTTALDTLYIDAWLPNEDYLYFEIIVDDLMAISNDTLEISDTRNINTVWLTHRSLAVSTEIFGSDPSVVPSGKFIIKEFNITTKKIQAEFYASMYASNPGLPDLAVLTNGIVQNGF